MARTAAGRYVGRRSVVITHDRHLMDRLTTARGEGRVIEIEAAAPTSIVPLPAPAPTPPTSKVVPLATSRLPARKRRARSWPGARCTGCCEVPRLEVDQAQGAFAESANEIRRRAGPAGPGVRDSDLLLDVGTTRLGNQVIELIGVSQSIRIDPAARPTSTC